VADARDLARRAEAIFDEDVAFAEQMGDHGVALFDDGDNVLTHCNSGGLVSAGIGTGLGVVRRAFERGKKIHVYVDETRPLLQGARLTAWELGKLGIPYTLICDNMAASLMAKGRIQRVVLGADRIAKNGDFANKVGTYGVAVAARFHGVPFHVVAPRTTVDLGCASGAMIPIEERDASEVCGASGSFGSVAWGPSGCAVYSPAFDVTPVALVTGMVLDFGYVTRADIEVGALERACKS
jgi:methylthioribose-1-phosphate isomerase